MTKKKHTQVLLTLDLEGDEVENIFNRSVTPEPAPSPKGYMIVKNLTTNQASVINECKVELVRAFGSRAAAKYIEFAEDADSRGFQFWLRYQVERSAHQDGYSVVHDAEGVIKAHPEWARPSAIDLISEGDGNG